MLSKERRYSTCQRLVISLRSYIQVLLTINHHMKYFSLPYTHIWPVPDVVLPFWPWGSLAVSGLFLTEAPLHINTIKIHIFSHEWRCRCSVALKCPSRWWQGVNINSSLNATVEQSAVCLSPPACMYRTSDDMAVFQELFVFIYMPLLLNMSICEWPFQQIYSLWLNRTSRFYRPYQELK